MNRKTLSFFCSLLFIIVASGCGVNHTVIPHGSDILSDPAIVHGRLSNGFGYILLENKTPENRISMHLDVFAGSMNETDEQQGIAHYLEHMVFNGSTHFKPGELVEYFQSIGMDFGPDANAHTGFYNTVYDLNLSKNDEQSIRDALMVMDDYARGALLLPDEVEREKGIILAEMLERDSVSYRTFLATLDFQLPGSALNQRHPIGQKSDIENTDASGLKDYYSRWYRPEDMVLIVVGDFKSDQMVQYIESRFNDFLPRRFFKGLAAENRWDSHQGIKAFYHYEPEAGQTDVTIETISEVPFVQETISDLKTAITRDLADAIVTNRLSRMLSQKNSPFSDAGVYSGIFLHSVQLAAITATAVDGNWEACLENLETILRQALEYGFTNGELEQVRSELITSLETQAEKSVTRESKIIANSFLYQLNNKRLFISLNQKKDLLKPFIEALTLNDVHQAFIDSWAEPHRLILITGNSKIHQTDGSDPSAVISGVYKKSISRKVDIYQPPSEKKFPYLPDPVDAGEISHENHESDLGISQITFKNNTRLNLKKTTFKKGEFLVKVGFGKGRQSEPADHPGISDLTELVIEQSGLGGINKEELSQALAGKNLNLEFSISENRFLISGNSGTSEVKSVFQLISHYFRDPGFREAGLVLAKRRYREYYDGRIRTPEGMMNIKGDLFLSGYDSRFGMPDPDQVDTISLADITNWVTDDFNHSPIEVSIAGDFDENDVIEAARIYIGSLAHRSFEHEGSNPRENPHITSEKKLILELDTKISKSMVQMVFPTSDFWHIDQTRKLSVLTRIFSERLRKIIREKLGAAYSPYVYNRPSLAYDNFGMIYVVVNVEPSTEEYIADQIRDIATALYSDGISEYELELVKQPVMSHVKEVIKTNDYWLDSVLADSFFHPEKIEWARTFKTAYSLVSKGEIDSLSRQFLNPDNMIMIIIKPKTI